jgi:hypothetical protein
MSDAGCPPFREIIGYLFCIVLSVSMMVYLLPGLVVMSAGPWVFLLAFCAIVVYSFVRLGQVLFPARWRRCSGSALVKRMMEIEGRV